MFAAFKEGFFGSFRMGWRVLVALSQIAFWLAMAPFLFTGYVFGFMWIGLESGFRLSSLSMARSVGVDCDGHHQPRRPR